MKNTIACVGFAIMMAGVTAGRQGNALIEGEIVVDGGPPPTLRQMCEKADVIADVTVQSVYPTTRIKTPTIGTGLVETDVLLRVDRLLKGAAIQQFVVSIPGGTIDNISFTTPQFFPMTAGERFIVFMRTPYKQIALPVREGIQRLDSGFSFAGTFRVSEGRIQTAPGLGPTESLKQYSGTGVNDMLAAIAKELQR
jgi:hypothetical protein